MTLAGVIKRSSGGWRVAVCLVCIAAAATGLARSRADTESSPQDSVPDRFVSAQTPVPTSTVEPKATVRPRPTATPMPFVLYLPGPEAVSTLQEQLLRAGYGVAVDGVLGPNTRAAVAQWQAENGLEESGELDRATFLAMDADLQEDLQQQVSALAADASEADVSPTVRELASPRPQATATPRPQPTARPQPTVEPLAPPANCHGSYDPCLTPGIGDYDCAGGSGDGPNYTGTVRVIGWDQYGLDRDNDGLGCE